MSSPSDRPPDPAQAANPHFLRDHGRPEKRKSESPLAADTMLRTGLIGRDDEQDDEQEQERGDRGGSPTKKVKRSSRFSPASASSSSLLVDNPDPEAQAQLSMLNDLERDTFLAQTLQDQLDKSPPRGPTSPSSKPEAKRNTQLAMDEDLARALMEQDMRETGHYHSDSDVVMTDDSQLDAFLDNSDEEFNDASLYNVATDDWNDVDNYVSDTEKTIKTEQVKAAAERSRDLSPSGGNNSQLFKSVSGMEDSKREETEKVFKELLEYAEKGSEKQRESGYRRRSSLNASRSSVPPQLDSALPNIDPTHGNTTNNKSIEIIDLTTPYEPSPSVAQLQQWYSSQRLNSNCRTCHGDLTIDNSSANELVRLWTGIDLMAKTPKNPMPSMLHRASLGRRLRLTPSRAVSKSIPTTSNPDSKGEDTVKELSYHNLLGTAKCKGSCAKVSCLECGAYCDSVRQSREKPVWHCGSSRPLSLLIVLGALDEWVLKGKKEDALGRRRNENAGHDWAQGEAEPDKGSTPSWISQRPQDAARRPYETKLRTLLLLEVGYGPLVQKMDILKKAMSKICEIRRILDNSKMAFKEALANEENLRETLRQMEYEFSLLKDSFISELDKLAKQKSTQPTTLLSRIRKHAGDGHHDDHSIKPLDTMRTTRSMSAKMAGLKDRILSKSSTTTSKQEKKKPLFGHAQKTHSDGLTLPSATPKYIGFHEGVASSKTSVKVGHGSWGSKYKKPNGTGYGGGPYYGSYYDMEELEELDALEEYTASLISPTDSIIGTFDTAEHPAFQETTAKQLKAALDPPKQPSHSLSMVKAIHDLMAEHLEAKNPGSRSFKPDDLYPEASSTKGLKSPKWTGLDSPGPFSGMVRPPSAEGFQQIDHPSAMHRMMRVNENNKVYVESLTASKKMPIISGEGTQSQYPHHKLPLGVNSSFPHPQKQPTNLKPMLAGVEQKQQLGSNDGGTPQKTAPFLIDLTSGDEAKKVLVSPTSNPKWPTYGAVPERLANKAVEASKQTKTNKSKMGSSANDSIIVDSDSDESPRASKSFGLAQRSASTGAVKKTTLPPQLGNGIQEQQNIRHQSTPMSSSHPPIAQSQSAFQLPPLLSRITRSGTGQHQMSTGAPTTHEGSVPQPHQPGAFLPYTSFHASSLQAGNAEGSAHLNPSTKPQGQGWGTYAKSLENYLENYAQSHSNATPHLPYHPPSIYGPLPGFTQMAAGNGPPSNFGNLAQALQIPSPPEPPFPTYTKPPNGSEISWTSTWPTSVSPHVPPPSCRRVARVASVHVERRNIRQEHQDRVLRSIFEMLTGAMPGENDLLGHDTYPVDGDVLLTMLNTSWLGEKMEELLRNDSMTDISKRSELYVALLGLTRRIGQCAPIASFLGLPRETKRMSSGLLKIAGREGELELESDASATLWELLEKLVKQAKVILKGLETSNYHDIESEDMSTVALCVEMVSVFESVQPSVGWSKERARAQTGRDRPCGTGKGKQKASDSELKQPNNSESSVEANAQAYRQRQIRFHQNLSFEHITEFTNNHYHTTEIQLLRHSPKGRIMHLTKELATMATSLPEGIFVRVSDGRPDVMKCLITGPEGTPYEGGLFEFDVWCPEAYPNCPPKCQLKTTGGGTVGFNPNLYPDGKGA
ncbi:hypothetical protein GP486_001305 [Trichoglossum hirsutum]|uniref:UBC core domain-containing protein n=1 Tax=Trichoglossum hirsutum TaxID=265104 RepID=A0A9P8RSR8_9PEZI|nr:hypothetical protein GP486_001305 [Trichoglossum hirsutum]